jgi:hypothetical protein
MSSSPLSPRVLHGALVCLDPVSFAVSRIIEFLYNPETLCRKLEPPAAAVPDSTNPSPAILPTAPKQVIRFTLQLDATDQLEFPDQNPLAVQFGVHPVMSAIEMLMYPPSTYQDAMTLFVWGANRAVPVRVAELQIVEQIFDSKLNPIRVEMAVTLVVRSEVDFPRGAGARKFWDEYLANLERLAALMPDGSIGNVGVAQV